MRLCVEQCIVLCPLISPIWSPVGGYICQRAWYSSHQCSSPRSTVSALGCIVRLMIAAVLTVHCFVIAGLFSLSVLWSPSPSHISHSVLDWSSLGSFQRLSLVCCLVCPRLWGSSSGTTTCAFSHSLDWVSGGMLPVCSRFIALRRVCGNCGRGNHE